MVKELASSKVVFRKDCQILYNFSHLNRIPKIEYSCDGEVYQPILAGELQEIQKKCDHRHDGHEKGQHVGECELTPKDFFDPLKCPGRHLRLSFNMK